MCSCDESSPLGEGHLDVVARQQRSIRELKLEHLSFVIVVIIIWAWGISQDVINTAFFATL